MLHGLKSVYSRLHFLLLFKFHGFISAILPGEDGDLYCFLGGVFLYPFMGVKFLLTFKKFSTLRFMLRHFVCHYLKSADQLIFELSL